MGGRPRARLVRAGVGERRGRRGGGRLVILGLLKALDNAKVQDATHAS